MATATAAMKAITNLTAEELAGLNKKPFIKVQWRQKSTDKLQIVLEEFPKAIAMAFSPLINDHFADKFPAGRISMVEGATLQIFQLVFDWMLRCCQKHVILSFLISGSNPFAVYLNAYIAADYLQIVRLKNDIYARLIALANTEFQCAEDVNELYYYFKKGHPLRAMIINGAVKCWFTGEFGEVGKTSDEYYDEIVEDFEEDVKRQFRKELKENDPRWAERAKLAGSEGLKQYRRLEDMPQK